MVGFNAKAANVPALQGKFTLPFVTHWGQATLPAGDYSFTLDKNYPGSVVTIFQGTRSVARIQTPGINYIKGGRSEIVMEGGTVREVNLPQIGVSLHYPAPNSGHRQAPKQPLISRTIPVSMTGVGR
jgi:hypothetical protein